jgi:hypothetical protein
MSYSGQGGGPRKSGWARLWEVGPAWITALSGIIVALAAIGFFVGHATATVNDAVPTPTVTVTKIVQVAGPASSSSNEPTAAAAASSSAGTYSTPEPGPGCDKNGATWSEVDVQFTGGACNVEATVQNQYGFLNVALPGGQMFAQNNTVSITGSLGNSGSGYDSACLGIEEDGSSAGYLASYCNDGDWYVYSTTGEVVGHQLTTGSIPMGPNGTTYEMTLSLNAGTLSLTFNNVNASGSFKVATLKIASFTPAQVGIGYEYGGYQVAAPATNFTYAAQ